MPSIQTIRQKNPPSPAGVIILCMCQLATAGFIIAAGCFTHYYDHRSGLPMFATGPYFFVAIGLLLTIWGVLKTRLWTLPLTVSLLLIFGYVLVFFFPWSVVGTSNSPYWFLIVLEAAFFLFILAIVIAAQLFSIFTTIKRLKTRKSSMKDWEWPFELTELAFMGILSPFVYYLDYQLPMDLHRRRSNQLTAEDAKTQKEIRERDEETSKAIERLISAVERGDDAGLHDASDEMGQVRHRFYGTDFELGDKLANPMIRRAVIAAIHQHQIEGGSEIMKLAASNEAEDPANKRLAFEFLLRGTWGRLNEPYIGPSSPEMIPFVLQMVRDDPGASSELRVWGIEALSRVSINSGSRQHMPLVVTELRKIVANEPNPDVRAAAAKAIPTILENQPELQDLK